MKTLKLILSGISVFLLVAVFHSCSDDDPNAKITINEGPEPGDIGGDFTGSGGSVSETFGWPNGLSTAEYNADITSSVGGTFNMVIRDADGAVVLDRSLEGGKEPDSFSGVTSSGTSGSWTVTITLTNFRGDGSFSISAGN